MQKEEKKHAEKDQQKHELKEDHNQKQDNVNKGRRLKEQEGKQETFADRQIAQEEMTQAFFKQSAEDRKSSRPHNHKEEEKDDDNKKSCVIS